MVKIKDKVLPNDPSFPLEYSNDKLDCSLTRKYSTSPSYLLLDPKNLDNIAAYLGSSGGKSQGYYIFIMQTFHVGHALCEFQHCQHASMSKQIVFLIWKILELTQLKCGDPPHRWFCFSRVLVTQGQSSSDDIKWKIPHFNGGGNTFT